ncbi:MAG: glycosyltransferase [Gemmatimonas sp.]|nr:glycosyltransferase [Gemmatimonas sp.]
MALTTTAWRPSVDGPATLRAARRWAEPRMRVAYFTESLYPHVDGVSRTLARLFDTLLLRGIDFRVFSPFLPPKEVGWRDRVRVMRYVRFPPYPDYRVSLPYGQRIGEALEEFGADLVHVVSPTPLAYRAQGIARRLGIPVVGSFHTHFASYFRYYGLGPLEPIGWRLLRAFYSRCERVYAPSASIGRELASQGIESVELWSRGIDLAGFSPEHRDPAIRGLIGAADTVPVLLMVSRLVREKDLADLVEIDRILRGRGVRFALALVGDGPMRARLERKLSHGTFAGHRSGPDLARWYASADVFVFPSTTETLGNVVLEALASGLPAVVSDRGGPQDMIRHGENGFIARANDPFDFATHLQRLLENPDLRTRLAHNARASADSRDWHEINGTLLDSYRKVVTRRAHVQPSR